MILNLMQLANHNLLVIVEGENMLQMSAGVILLEGEGANSKGFADNIFLRHIELF